MIFISLVSNYNLASSCTAKINLLLLSIKGLHSFMYCDLISARVTMIINIPFSVIGSFFLYIYFYLLFTRPCLVYSHNRIEPLTWTFNDRIIPNCGISMHSSSISIYSTGMPSCSFPSSIATLRGKL